MKEKEAKSSLSENAIKHMSLIIDPHALNQMISRLLNEQCQKNTLPGESNRGIGRRLRGSAISKSKNKEESLKIKEKIEANKEEMKSSRNNHEEYFSVQSHNSKLNTNQEDEKLERDETKNIKFRKDRAVFYGSTELPYLHSTDALNILYKPSNISSPFNEALVLLNPINPSPHILSSLKELFLYHTMLDSLGQLGTGWSNLCSLTVTNSPLLTSLSSLSIFPSLQYLFVPFNNISEISGLMYHASLICVDLEGNQIKEREQLEYLQTVDKLEWICVEGNPVFEGQHGKEFNRTFRDKMERILEDTKFDRNIEDYVENCFSLDAEVQSYWKIETSNRIIQEINSQILNDQIYVGQYWRKCYDKSIQQVEAEPSGILEDIEIIEFYEMTDDDEVNDESKEEELKLRVTPLEQYIPNKPNLECLERYFKNKISLQLKEQNKRKLKLAEESQILKEEDGIMKKFALTQVIKPSLSEEKGKTRFGSVSLKKRLGKLSLAKAGDFSTIGSHGSGLLSIKPKTEFLNSIANPSGTKFLAKRKLFGRSPALANEDILEK